MHFVDIKGFLSRMQPFTQRVIEIIKTIPEGFVMTYGQIAEINILRIDSHVA